MTVCSLPFVPSSAQHNQRTPLCVRKSPFSRKPCSRDAARWKPPVYQRPLPFHPPHQCPPQSLPPPRLALLCSHPTLKRTCPSPRVPPRAVSGAASVAGSAESAVTRLFTPRSFQSCLLALDSARKGFWRISILPSTRVPAILRPRSRNRQGSKALRIRICSRSEIWTR